jgi:hypothetical protein
MSGDRAPIRSYQRIFQPERRIYQIEGHRLPVPGGVPLRWLGYAIGALLAILLLSSRSIAVAGLIAALAAVYALAIGGRSTAALAGASVFGGVQILGWLVGTLDWPLQLLVVPALVATLATQATPDGRAAHRYALSWIALQLRPARRSLARPLPALGELRDLAGRLWVAADWHTPILRHARLHGPAQVQLTAPLSVVRGRLRKRRLTASVQSRRSSARAVVVDRVELATDETLELRP